MVLGGSLAPVWMDGPPVAQMFGAYCAAEFAGEEPVRDSGESNPSSVFGPVASPDLSFHRVSLCWKSAGLGPGVSSSLWNPWTT